jgi:glycosyltransferase involved in cell wall biosynthesis
MSSFLSDYSDCADRREDRFRFAVKSFLRQNMKNSELVIISDGCDLTEKIWNNEFKKESRIIFDKIDRPVFFSGSPRNHGISISNGSLICYLDSDDFIGPNHVSTIYNNFSDDIDWCFYDDYIYRSKNIFKRRNVNLKEMRIGTCSICHKKDIDVKWEDGYGHDHRFIKEMLKKGCIYKKIPVTEYFVCHVPIPGRGFDIDHPNYSYVG